MRESFIFYKSYADQLRKLPDEQFATIMKAIFDYALEGAEGELGVIESVIFGLIKPQLDANNVRYENGKKGGRPKTETEAKGNQTETNNKPNENQSITETEATETIPKPNENVNVNVNVNVNEKENEYLRTQKEKSDEGGETFPLSAEESSLNENAGKKRKEFIPPTLEEVTAYAEERGRVDLAKKFFDYFEAGNWHDSEGKPVKAWKQKFITWEAHQPYPDTLPKCESRRPIKNIL